MQRGLKNRHIQLIAMGGIIGSCYFLGNGYLIDTMGPAACLAFLFGGMIVFMVTYCLGELAVAMPVCGSFVNYANDLISPTWAAGVGWSYYTNWVVYIPAEFIATGIIMNNFFPAVDPLYWSIIFGIILTIVNMLYVGTFGELEFWLALIKVCAIVIFTVLAVLIFFGLIGNQQGHVLGTSILLGSGGFFPGGFVIVLLSMSLIINNYLGSELIGIAAGESEQPEKAIPVAVRNVTFRIVAMFSIPTLLLTVIFPWKQAGLEESVFAAALNAYGFNWAGVVMSLVVLTAAVSCANSGIYGSSRAVVGMAQTGMAPRWMAKTNRRGVPYAAVIVCMIPAWIALFAYTLDTSGQIYTILLSLSGFTGLLSWICICWCQYNFRRRLEKMGVDAKKTLKFTMPYFPYVTCFAILIMAVIMLYTFINPDLRISSYIGIPMLVVPMILYHLFGDKEKHKAGLGGVNVFEQFLKTNGIKE
ncbi:amino acid permease [Candidatus Formimonas warabiya]|uniref:Amino acid permease n=1 Tax=Formimonas warabiya TaxID=1761012 RepID=A0A3G1L135_FORW1|nr:amino acid permease [Candidatus Formimonas warabiya]